MPRMSRGALAIRPVRSLKHIIDVATSAVLAVVSTVPVIETVPTPGLGNPTQVHEGSTVNAVYLRVEALATNIFAGVPRVYMSVFKNPGNNLVSPNPNASGIQDTKRYIIHQEMTMLSGATLEGFPRTVFQGVILIPKRLRRFGYNDRLSVLLQNGTGETTGISNVCVQCIYKEFT